MNPRTGAHGHDYFGNSDDDSSEPKNANSVKCINLDDHGDSSLSGQQTSSDESKSTLEEIHSKVISKLFSLKSVKHSTSIPNVANEKSSSSTRTSLLVEKLQKLKHKKSYLLSNIERIRQNSVVTTVQGELEMFKNRTETTNGMHSHDDYMTHCNSQPYTTRATNSTLTSYSDTMDEVTKSKKRKRSIYPGGHSHVKEQDEKTKEILGLALANLPNQMHKVRLQRRIAGSHRLAGISLLPSGNHDPNILSVRLDLCVEGMYVARHVLFFQTSLIRNNNNNNNNDNDDQKKLMIPIMRLIQHTLPAPIVPKLNNLQHRTNLVLPIHASNDDPDNHQSKEKTVGQLQKMIGNIYDLCYAYHVKKKGCEWLSEHQYNSCYPTNTNDSFHVYDLLFDDSYDGISFRLQNSTAHGKDESHSWEVNLVYEDPVVAVPSTVRLRRIAEPYRNGQCVERVDLSRGRTEVNNNNDFAEISDPEDDSYEDFLQQKIYRDAYLNLPIPIATEKMIRLESI